MFVDQYTRREGRLNIVGRWLIKPDPVSRASPDYITKAILRNVYLRTKRHRMLKLAGDIITRVSKKTKVLYLINTIFFFIGHHNMKLIVLLLSMAYVSSSAMYNYTADSLSGQTQYRKTNDVKHA